MGYETSYKLKYKWEEAPTEVEELKLELGLLSKDNGFYAPLMDFVNGYASACKWYECVEDMISFSKKFPKVLFTLSGKGEESGDLWIRYFKNGKVQTCRAKISYDEYDPSKLKDIENVST